MNIKQSIYTHLSGDANVTAVFGTKIIPQFVAADVAAPYIVFDRTTTDPVNTLGGVSDIRKETFTFLVYAPTRLEVETGKQILQTSLNSMRRTTVGSVIFSGAFEVATSDEFEIRGAADQEPAYSEVVSFTFWARAV